MKNIILSFLFVSAFILSVTAKANDAYDAENPDRETSEQAYALFDGFVLHAKPADVAGFPTELKLTDDGFTIVIADLFRDIYGKTLRESSAIRLCEVETDSIIFDLNDGDQVFMLKLKISDLKALGAGKVKSITGIAASGYWWKDGDHA